MSNLDVVTVAKTPFDYSLLSEDNAALAQIAVEEFGRSQKRIVSDIVSVGNALLEVKAAIDHGLFGRWLAAEFGADARTAQNYMNTALRFTGKTEIISNLPLSTVYRLAAPSTPEATREEISAKLTSGVSLPVVAIESAIAEAKEVEREARRVAKLSPEKAKADATRKKRQKRNKEADAAEREAEQKVHERKEIEACKREIQVAHLLFNRLSGSDADQAAIWLEDENQGVGRALLEILYGERVGTRMKWRSASYDAAHEELDGKYAKGKRSSASA